MRGKDADLDVGGEFMLDYLRAVESEELLLFFYG